MTQPFVQHADTRPELEWCDTCGSYSWRDLGHHCEVREQRMARIILLVAATLVLVFWFGVITGTWKLATR